ncbi:MAG: hypothetical protein DBX94_03210 [Coriobacteriia bacterium]|uniref:restriction endonuclease subunit S n=1 Tax=Paratractidigestivibacter sp. TaxID=2847316 RepID=UPI000D7A5114|nr:MAG: hypothetical protein DBX94_03210 [Coriobacteriia bacterium]
MGCKVVLGEICSFSRGASVPRARMLDQGDFLYIHYGDLYKGFDVRIDVDNPQKPIPYIAGSEPIRESQLLCDQDIVYVLTSETVEDLGHAFLFNNPKELPAVAGTETTIVRVNRPDLVLPSYLNWLFQSARFKKLLRQYVKGMKVFRVHPDDLARIEIEIPSIDDQRRIVSILDATFERPLINNRINGYLEEQCEAVANHEKGFAVELSTLCGLVKEKADYNEADFDTYVSTESLLPGKKGRQAPSSLPQTGKVTVYKAGDILVSNIRPYFKKIWYADRTGTCSGDVLVFRAKQPEQSGYLYSCMRSDAFFDYVMKGAKGTKMPRGDKKQMLTYKVASNPSGATVDFIESALSQASSSSKENHRLAALRDNLLPKLMSGEIDVSKVDLKQLNSHLS